ncbi:TetR/AcrR family transcriptional regulator [Nocardioides immobilis]|uniref:TetR/AcrR family transcriptional regulator n=1 Tax=Nocardioides immobilis TaxID=2049295 RepID=A0A417XZC3_9ACTN|nr:TetR/AcrR family transcriptional regulator [Nocardioides immobilis]RHW25723.1 TetR/AcrR family transcriptional regulator [Nocardioides immobilis]
MGSSSPLTVQARSGARRREATKARVVEATRRLLMDGEAYADLSMERIAKEAGVSRATLYLHFGDKRDILAQIAEEIVEQRFALGAEVLADPEIDRETLRTIVTDMTHRWMADAPLHSAIITLAEQDPDVRQLWVDAIHEVGAMGADLMRRHWGDGPSAAPDPDTIGQVLAWMFERSAHQLARDPEDEARVADAVSEVVWRVFEYRPR